MGRALAVVGVHAVHANAAILAAVARAVVDVVLTVLTCEAWQTKENQLGLILRLLSPPAITGCSVSVR